MKTAMNSTIAAAAMLALAGCGGGGGSSDSGSGGSASDDSGSTGSVGVLLTDAPTDVYEEMNLTVTEASLLPEEDAADAEAITLFPTADSAEEIEVDLLQLRDFSEFLSLRSDVPVDDYEKVRLHVSGIELVDEDAAEPVTEATLPSGRIDLVPREPLRVTSDDTLYIQLDIDAENSVVVTDTGSGETLFRPVALVEVLDGASGSDGGEETDAGSGESDEDGEETSADEEGTGEDEEGTTEDEEDMADDDDERNPLVSVQGALRSRDDSGLLVCPSANAAERACVRVVIEEGTGIYDGDAEPIGADALAEGDPLLVMGPFTRDIDNGQRRVEALTVTRGTRPAIGTRGGTAAGGVTEGAFELRNGRMVELAEGARVVDTDGEVAGTEAIVDGQALTLHGNVSGAPYVASLVILRGDDDDEGTDGADEASESGEETSEDGNTGSEPAQDVLVGSLVSVDSDNALQIEVDGTSRFVELAEDATVIRSGEGRVGESDLEALDAGGHMRIIARGTDDEAAFLAEQLIAIELGPGERPVDETGETDEDEQGADEEDGEDNAEGGPPESAGPPEGAA